MALAMKSLATRSSAFVQSLHLLGTRRFGTFWFASLASSIGTWTQQVAEPWLLLSLGASSFLIGLDSFAMNAPVWLLTVAGGMLADRADRRWVITGFQSLQMLCPAVIILALMLGLVKPWLIIALSVVVGVTDALSMPSFSSIVPTIVKHEDIGSALALNSTQFNLSRILGPAVAGMLMSSVGALACFVVSALSYLPFIGVALWILPRRADVQAARTSAPRPLEAHVFAGITTILRQGRPRGALLTVLISSILCAPIVAFIPVLVRDVYHGDASRFSLALACFGVGGLAGAAALLAVPAQLDRRRLSSWAALALGVVVMLIAVNPWFISVLALLALTGALLTVSSTAANTLLQSTAAPGLLGRTVSLYMMAMRGGISLGSLLVGLEISGMGMRRTLLIHGTVAAGAQLVVMRQWLRAPEALAPESGAAGAAAHAEG
jgi:predicted MFS family arabinose efflux permease